MRYARKLLVLAALFSITLGAAACLYTKHDIHITLDIRHVKQTATNIEDYVSGEKDLEEIKPQSMLSTPEIPLVRRLAAALNPAPRAAAADETTIKKMTPELEKALKDRRDRYNEIKQLKRKGLFGESATALLEIMPHKMDDPELDKRLNALKKEENVDRMTIYKEIAKQNNATSPEAMTKIQRAWAEVNRGKVDSGEFFQVPTDDEAYKKFVNSDLGKKFDTPPAKGSWQKKP